MSIIHHAIEIDTQTSVTDADLGIVSGVLRFITDRPGYDGTPTYPTWEDDTNNTAVWYEEFLLKAGIGSTNRRIDVTIGGDYGTLSGLRFKITNDQKFWSLLADNGIYLTNRKIIYYTVIDDKFFYGWAGLIANNPYDETDFSFSCKDSFSTEHDDFPPEVISNTNYPGVDDNSIGRAIPVCMGKVPYAELLDIGQKSEFVPLMEDSTAVEYESAGANDYITPDGNLPAIDLYTLNKTFAANEFDDGNYYLLVVAGGGLISPDTEILIPIDDNDATSSELTRVYLKNPIPNLDRGAFKPAGPISSDGVQSRTTLAAGTTTFLSDGWSAQPGTVYAGSIFTVQDASGTSAPYIVQQDAIIYTPPGPPGVNAADLILDRGLDSTVPNNAATEFQLLWYNAGAAFSDINWWYFKIVHISVDKVASNNAVLAFQNDTELYPIVNRYNTDLNQYDALFNIARTTNLADGALGIFTDKLEIDGDFKNQYPIVPDAVEVTDVTVGGTLTPVAGSVADLIDRDRTTTYDWNAAGDNEYVFRFWASTPNDLTVENVYDALYTALDVYYDFNAVLVVSVNIKIIYEDVYENDYVGGTTNTLTVGTSAGHLNFIPNSYYDLGGDDNGEASIFGDTVLESGKTIRLNDYLKLDDDFINQIRNKNGIRRFGFEFAFTLASITTGTVNLKQVGNIGEQQVNLKDDNIYVKCEGETVTFEDVYFGDATTDIIISAAQLNYITGTDPEFAANGLEPGDTFTIDIGGYSGNGSYTVATVAPVTSTITFTIALDAFSGVIGSTTALKGEDRVRSVDSVYRAFRHILENYNGISFADIDYTNLLDNRDDWPLARQITTRRNSMLYLKELCRLSFVGLFPTRDGKRGLKAWLDDETPVASHAPATILRGSIKSFVKTKIDKLFNDFTLNYSWSPGAGRFERTVFVTKVTEASFPGPAETEDGVLKWKRFVGGFDETLYNEAKLVWDVCHLTYERMLNVRELPSTHADLPWYVDGEIFDGSVSAGALTTDSVYKYLVNLVLWTTQQKDIVEYSLPLNADNVILELLDRVIFNDVIYTNSVSRGGYITKLEINPKTDMINVQVMLDAQEIVTDAIEDTYDSQEPTNPDLEDSYTTQEPTNPDYEDSVL